MNTAMAVNPKVVLDTNVIVSAIGFGGKPGQVFLLALEEEILAVTSEVLLAEVQEILIKKLAMSSSDVELIIAEIEDKFEVVAPKKSLHVVRDEDDNRILEAAREGNCDYIVTGDSDLLDLGKYKKIKILTAEEFLNEGKFTFGR